MKNQISLDERIKLFNSESDNRYLEEILGKDEDFEDALWESYSIDQLQELLSLNEDEARKLLKSGLFKVYRAGNEFRTAKKSVKENQQIVKTMLNYREKKTMSVPDLKRILGLGKTAVYRLVNQQQFKTFLVFGQMRIDVDSFEEWYANQFHYKKVNGERPGKNYGKTITSTTIGKVLGVSRATAREIIDKNNIELIWIDGTRRVIQESFEEWYASQNHYKKVAEVEEVERFVD